MGAQESIMRAAIAQIAPADRRGSTYGLFKAAYWGAVAWFAGGVLRGVLYDWSVLALVAASVGLQAAALPILLRLTRGTRAK